MNSKNIIGKEELYDLYVNQQRSTPQIANLKNCRARTIQNYLKRYQIPIRSFSEATRISSKQRTQETLDKRALKFRNTWYSKTAEERQLINKTRATKPENLAQSIMKAQNTKQRRGTVKKSKSEDDFYRTLQISFPDVERQYYDVRYPFLCDFYVPSKDLFIEYQGHYTHGTEPFDPYNIAHLKILANCTYDMTTWVIRDTNKLNIAKKNNLKLYLVYPKHTHYLLNNQKLTASEINELWKI